MAKIIIEIEVPNKMVAIIVNQTIKLQLKKMQRQSGAITKVTSRVKD